MDVNEPFRNPNLAERLLKELAADPQPAVIMEICGGQTHSLLASGLDQLLPRTLELVHGPGCPVCVTPVEMIDKAIHLAENRHVLFTTFGDMLRVPGSNSHLLAAKSRGADVRMLYSPLDALALAEQRPDKKVVFWAIGFETTAPATALAVWLAREKKVKNFSLLVSHVLVPPAMRRLLASPQNRVQAFLAAGHVCAVTGWQPYQAIAEEFHTPIVVTGFEPVDLLLGIHRAMQLLRTGCGRVENAYGRVVRRHGNEAALKRIADVYCECDRTWRGLGPIPASGLRLRDAFAEYDAEKIFDLQSHHAAETGPCISGLILQGLKKPSDCPSFSADCTPEHPLGAPMVSAEGVCAAYYHYKTE